MNQIERPDTLAIRDPFSIVLRVLAGVVFCSLCSLPLAALAELSEEETLSRMIEFEAALEYQSGDIELPDVGARLNLGGDYRYLDPEQTSRVLEQAWGNPPGAKTLGAIVPADFSVFSGESWAVILSFDEDGYVSDEDAAEIQYDELLIEMQEEINASNDERERLGYSRIELVGWADEPHYDADSHQLYWAKELIFDGSDRSTLNYSIRALGRRGVLVMNAVSSMDQLWEVREGMQGLLPTVEFDVGSRYVDFDPDVDTVAAYGIGALVAGKLAAKAGLLAKFSPLLLIFKKYAIVLVIGAGALLKRAFGGRKEDLTAELARTTVVEPPDPPTQV
ncbi:MAG: DUF2167 domain-containing protein [Deltaproteobacteria bacterium]|nr:DUF2167 domain-containing protein [Deltaproteobacteria bacterium]